eukprot:c55140_g1_i1 orf=356-739(+)
MLGLMGQQGTRADFDTYMLLLQGCIDMRSLAEGRQVHAHVIESGFKSNIFMMNSLVNMYCKCGSTDLAREVFDNMPRRDVISWNTMITGYTHHGQDIEALTLFLQMQQERMNPDNFTFVSILKACAN